MRTFLTARSRPRPDERHQPYGAGPDRADHRGIRTGHVVHPEWNRKLSRMITRLFR